MILDQNVPFVHRPVHATTNALATAHHADPARRASECIGISAPRHSRWRSTAVSAPRHCRCLLAAVSSRAPAALSSASGRSFARTSCVFFASAARPAESRLRISGRPGVAAGWSISQAEQKILKRTRADFAPHICTGKPPQHQCRVLRVRYRMCRSCEARQDLRPFMTLAV